MKDTKKFEEEFNFIGWFGEDSEELEDYEDGSCEKTSEDTKINDEKPLFEYDYD